MVRGRSLTSVLIWQNEATWKKIPYNMCKCCFVVFTLSLGMLQTLPLPTAKCYMFHWDKDNFGKGLCSSVSHEMACHGIPLKSGSSLGFSYLG